jgi:membrane-associated phospholipid phosphatase
MSDLQHPTVNGGSAVEKADAAVADAFLPAAGNGLVRGMGATSDLTDQEPLYAAAGAVIGTGLILRDERTIRAGTRLLASHLLATALRGVIKHMVDRTRPDVAAERGEYELSKGERFESDFNSFPSGHTAGAVAAARALGRHYPGSRGAWLGLAGAAAAAQVFRSKQYVTDVVAGAAIGFIAEEAVHRLLCRAERV